MDRLRTLSHLPVWPDRGVISEQKQCIKHINITKPIAKKNYTIQYSTASFL